MVCIQREQVFFFNNQEKIGSYFGLFLTLVYIFASLGLFFYQIIFASQRKELKVYDTTIYGQKMPSITINSNQLYFAFGLEDPNTSNKFIDNSIYVPKITFIDKIKKNEELITVNQKNLEYEQCKIVNFGKNYQHLFIKDELNGSYCLKDFDYNLTLAGGYKYEKMSYIIIKIVPCVNSTENNNSCKPQEEIDYYLTSGYFSIILKDIGLNPSNYSFPATPTLQNLFTTIDKRINRNYILNFGLTEVHTDTGIFNEKTNIKKYLKFRKDFQNFQFRDENDNYSGKNIILVQLKLDDTIIVQKRSYTKITDIFSRIGGYMQLINTVFLLLSSLINRLNSEIKIINGIFNFNLKQNKIILKFQKLKKSNTIVNSKKNKYIIFSPKKSDDNLKSIEIENKSKNNLILKDNELGNIISGLNIYGNKNYLIENNGLKLNNNINQVENSKNNSIKSKNDINLYHHENIISFNNVNLKKNNNDLFHKEKNNLKDFNDHIYLNLFDYFCSKRDSKKYKLFNTGNSFFRKRMDIVHVFTIISIIEKILINHNYQDIFSLYEEID